MKRVLHFMRNPKPAHTLVELKCLQVFIFNKNDKDKLELVGDYHFPLWHQLEGDQIGKPIVDI